MQPADDAETTAARVRSGAERAAEVLERCLERIAVHDAALGAFVHVDADGARAAAAAVDRAVDAGIDPGPLCGVPIGVKDLEDVAGLPTSHGSRLFAGHVAGDDSIHVARLRAAGAVVVGKTAAPELGTTNHTTSIAWGTTRNPWDTTRTPGGSSGGSAAAVSAGLVPLATASDGGGSIRSPAAFCGLVGHKPTYGVVPRLGPDVSELTADGVVATTVADVALALDVAAGPDPRVRTSLPRSPVIHRRAIESLDAGGLRARWSPDLGGTAPCDPEVSSLAQDAALALADAAGLALDDEPFDLGRTFGAYLSTTRLDAWVTVGEDRWPGCADRLEPSTVEAMAATADLPLTRWVRSVRRRTAVVERFAALMSETDVVLCPSTAVVAFGAEEPTLETVAAATPYTMVANLTGAPAVSVPAGVTGAGLPVGLQIIGPRFADALLLRLARILEQARPWPRHAPGW